MAEIENIQSNKTLPALPEGVKPTQPLAARTALTDAQRSEEQRRQSAADEAQYERDEADRLKGQTALRQAWGENYSPRMNEIKNMISALPENIRNKVLEARLQDGTRLANNTRAIASMRRLAEITAYMRKDRATYNKDGATQAEFVDRINELMRAIDR